MKALVFNKKLLLTEVKKPLPNKNEVLVKVVSASINAADYRTIKMGMLPKHKIMGSAIAGVVEELGSNIKDFKIGDKVVGDLADYGFGGLAEYIAAPQSALAHLPEDMEFNAAVVLPVAATTALKAVRDKGSIKKGQRVLVVGSAGGVGSFAVQLAHYFGGEVTAVCSTKNLKQSVTLGADKTIDYTTGNFIDGAERYDLVLAINGNYPLLAYHKILNKTGICVMVGGSLSQLFKAMFLGWILSLGGKKIKVLSAKSCANDLAFLVKLLFDKKINPVIEKEFMLSNANNALDYLKLGHAQGKIIIKIQD